MIAAGILLAAVAATHFASVEGDEWKSSPLQNMSERSGGSEAANSTLELFATDGKTPRAGSVPWRDSTEALCYRNPDGGIIVVATNWANEERRVSFRIAGKMYVAALRPHSFNTVVLWHAPLSLQGKP